MGKLRSLRKAILKNPDLWMNAAGAWWRDGQWHQTAEKSNIHYFRFGSWYYTNRPYLNFIQSVLASLGIQHNIY